MTKRFNCLPHVAAAVLAMIAGSASASEGGGSTYPSGVENFMSGAVPPPGFYVLGYGEVLSATRLNDANGDRIPVPGFKVSAQALVPRFVWSTPHQIAGGNLVLHAIVPMVNLKVSAGGASQSKSGVGDITFGPAIAHHHSPNLHTVLALDFVAPTGGYRAGDLANIGRNYWSIQPVFAVTQLDPAGWNADAKVTFNFNRTNGDTGYRSGNEVNLDYALGWGLGNGWVVGIGGSASEQLSDDKAGGVSLANSKTRYFAIGPSVKYDNGKGFFVAAKVQKDLEARNRIEGTAFWVKAVLPF